MKFPSYGAAGMLTVCLFSTPVFANSLGLTGNSGKSGQTCTACHKGGAATTVEISGPTTLEAGATGQYTLIIRGGPGLKGGFNVAVDNTAASLTAGTGSKKVGSELTQSAPKPASGGDIRFDFSLVAPQSSGTVKLFGAGNSVNGDGTTSGDMAATTTASVTITGGTTPPPSTGNEDEGGGCSTTGGAPVMLLSLLAGGRALLRRRRA